MTELRDRKGLLSNAKEATPSLCVAKPVHVNVPSCLCLSLRLGEHVHIYAGVCMSTVRVELQERTQ